MTRRNLRKNVMKCPSCAETTLVMAERQGVEIDYCPSCRGIWLDRGELDKLLDKAAAVTASTAPAIAASAPVHRAHQPDFEDSNYRGAQRYHRDRKNRGSTRFLIEAWVGPTVANRAFRSGIGASNRLSPGD